MSYASKEYDCEAPDPYFANVQSNEHFMQFEGYGYASDRLQPLFRVQESGKSQGQDRPVSGKSESGGQGRVQWPAGGQAVFRQEEFPGVRFKNPYDTFDQYRAEALASVSAAKSASDGSRRGVLSGGSAKGGNDFISPSSLRREGPARIERDMQKVTLGGMSPQEVTPVDTSVEVKKTPTAAAGPILVSDTAGAVKGVTDTGNTSDKKYAGLIQTMQELVDENERLSSGLENEKHLNECLTDDLAKEKSLNKRLTEDLAKEKHYRDTTDGLLRARMLSEGALKSEFRGLWGAISGLLNANASNKEVRDVLSRYETILEKAAVCEASSFDPEAEVDSDGSSVGC